MDAYMVTIAAIITLGVLIWSIINYIKNRKKSSIERKHANSLLFGSIIFLVVAFILLNYSLMVSIVEIAWLVYMDRKETV